MIKSVSKSLTISAFFISNLALAQSCPFNEATERPDWVYQLGSSGDSVVASGVIQYLPEQHSSIFELRKASEQQAMLSVATQLESKVANDLLLKKNLQEKQLLTNVKKITSQVTEYTLPEVSVSARWLDTQNCTLWTQVSVGEDVVMDYIDEISELEGNIEQAAYTAMKLSVREELNKKQFYLNYQGFTKAIQGLSHLEFSGERKPTLTWMIEEGFDPVEPSQGENGVWSDKIAVTFNVSPIELYILTEAPSTAQLEYILDAYQAADKDINEILTAIHPQQFAHTINFSDSDYFISAMTGQVNALEAPYRLSVSLAEEQANNRLKLDKPFANKTSFDVGEWNLLHLAVFAKRSDLIKTLIKRGLDPNFKDVGGMSPAQYAVWTEDESLITPFLEQKLTLDNIYLTLTRVMLDKALVSSANPQKAVDSKVLEQITKSIEAKSGGEVSLHKKQLKQDIKRLEQYYALEINEQLKDSLKDKNIEMLKQLL
ncbi:ankyrin repeat domain-containing protein [Vibrio sp. AIC-3]|uniref:ankyrin repeat domain-containing protein n=1 Tax=Vibrio sp. AIC-3 TaxID=2607604 RepID=UPI00149354B2|nr:ankyrin repeat domain-containing protein [Vibrio sp. AIC-3]NOH93157.1 ankyrin repeat domain-containing protein [Vibrio sp. AIC-3]